MAGESCHAYQANFVMKISRPSWVLAALLPVLVLASCADMAERSVGVSSADLSAAAPNPVNYSVGSGTPDGLAALAAKHNPAIAALRHRAERFDAEATQAGALPDPMLNISSQSKGTVGVSQEIPLAGKRDAAKRASLHEAAAVRADAASLTLQISEQVKSAWWDFYLAERTIAYTNENRALLSSIKGIVGARVEADSAAQADQLRIVNEITALDKDLADLRQLRSSAIARINSLLNRPAGASIPTPGEPSIPATAGLERLIARAQQKNPDITAAQQRVDAFNQRLRRAKLERYPDPNIGINHSSIFESRSSRDGDPVAATLGFNIPLWREPRRAMVREATAGIAETQALLKSSRADISYRVEDAYFRAKTAREVTALFRDRLIPSAKQASELTLTAYSTGKGSFADVIDTQREILTYQLQLVKSRADLGKAVATLEAAAAL